MSKKMTAVDWLVDELLYDFSPHSGDIPQYVIDAINKAKAMEKEQITSAFGEGVISACCSTKMNGEEYYNETYKSE